MAFSRSLLFRVIVFSTFVFFTVLRDATKSGSYSRACSPGGRNTRAHETLEKVEIQDLEDQGHCPSNHLSVANSITLLTHIELTACQPFFQPFDIFLPPPTATANCSVTLFLIDIDILVSSVHMDWQLGSHWLLNWQRHCPLIRSDHAWLWGIVMRAIGSLFHQFPMTVKKGTRLDHFFCKVSKRQHTTSI